MAASPDDPQMYCYLFHCYLHADQINEAKKVVEAGLKISPNHGTLNYCAGLVHSRQGDTKTAMERYERAILLEPELIDARFSRAFLLEQEEHNWRKPSGNGNQLSSGLAKEDFWTKVRERSLSNCKRNYGHDNRQKAAHPKMGIRGYTIYYWTPSIRWSSSSLSITVTPSSRAFVSLLPALSPAMTKSVFFDTLPATFAPSASSRFAASSRVID